MDHVFGPVLSRRLGLSLGVDLLPLKTCSMDCSYCEIGSTTCLTTRRDRFVPEMRVLREIRSVCDQDFDFLTFAGSGEPTLHSGLGDIIRAAREMMDRPIAVITNSSLLTSPAVRREVASADLVLPSLDAASQDVFEQIDRPAPGLLIGDIIEGLKSFRTEFGGEIWLEVMLVKGVNETDVERIAKAAEEISPDRLQLNTVVRPPSEPVLPLSQDEMLDMLEVFPDAEIIPDWDWQVPPAAEAQILSLLNQGATVEDLSAGTELSCSDLMKYLKILEAEKKITRSSLDGRLFFFAKI